MVERDAHASSSQTALQGSVTLYAGCLTVGIGVVLLLSLQLFLSALFCVSLC